MRTISSFVEYALADPSYMGWRRDVHTVGISVGLLTTSSRSEDLAFLLLLLLHIAELVHQEFHLCLRPLITSFDLNEQ